MDSLFINWITFKHKAGLLSRGGVDRVSMENKENLITRIKTIYETLKSQGNGADVHLVGSMRNVAVLLLAELERRDCKLSLEEAAQIVKNLERQAVDFYIKKFGYLK